MVQDKLTKRSYEQNKRKLGTAAFFNFFFKEPNCTEHNDYERLITFEAVSTLSNIHTSLQDYLILLWVATNSIRRKEATLENKMSF